MRVSNQAAGALNVRPGTGENGGSTVNRTGVEEIQRARILTAMVEVSREHGPGDATVARVVDRAGVSRRTFYELFEDRERCFLAALDRGSARVSQAVLESYDPDARWAERIRTGLTGLFSFLDLEPGVGWLLIVCSLGAGTDALERRRHVLAQITTVIDQGRMERRGTELPSLMAEGIVGGALSIIQARLLDEGGRRLIELLNPLMGMIVLPYLGPNAARTELEHPVPTRDAGAAAHGSGDPLRDLEMRLTYRTVRVLREIAAVPGASNREIGDAAGVSDQGQISKLLTRLERLGLVRKIGSEPGKGAPNAWALSDKGAEVEPTMSAETGRSPQAIDNRSHARGRR